MTPAPGMPIEKTETADEYGRREKCFRSYRRHPFTFQSHITDIKNTKEVTEEDGFVAQLGLKISPLPHPQLTGDVFDQHRHHQEELEKLLDDSPSNMSLSAIGTITKELSIPVDELDLGSCLETDLQEHLRQVHAKRFSNPFNQWLPLACIREEKDEGLSFPPELDRLRELLRRELDIDKPIISATAARLVQEQNTSLTSSENLLLQQNRIKPYQYSHLDPLSPPLSPVSDDDDALFIPDGDVTIIDLVSEPCSPGRAVIEDIQRDMESDPVVSSTFLTSPPAGESPQRFQTSRALIQDAKTEAIIPTSSNTPSEFNYFTDICLPLIGGSDEEIFSILEEKGHFEDAFMTLLEDRRYYANQLVNQERFEATDAISRVPVPLLNFEISSPEWAIEHFTAKTHFTFLRKSMPRCFNLFPIPRDPRSEISLRWAVFPLEKRRPIKVDELAIPDEILAKYLFNEPASLVSSFDFVLKSLEMNVLSVQHDKEIEMDDEGVESPPAITPQHESPNCHQVKPGNKTSMTQRKDTPDLNPSTRRKLDDEFVRLLPKSYDTSATSILLHNFMELKGIKRPRLNTDPCEMNEDPSILPSVLHNEASMSKNGEVEPLGVVEENFPAPIPRFEIPSEKASFIVSIDVARPVLRRLEDAWTSEKLIDMDYSRQNSGASLPVAAQPQGSVSLLTFEADISLSPSTGIVVTNILKVRQRPLPGSQYQTPLRERVQKVSQKYETLIVLVSESQPKGEVMEVLAPSDIAAYADFTSFTAALEGSVNVHFIPGATETITSWVLAFMCQQSPRSKAFSKYLSSEETLWEIFLRRAGLNIIAAKVLSKTLFEQAGVSGLALFLKMPISERVARYGPLLGGERMLRLTSKALDQRWGG